MSPARRRGALLLGLAGVVVAADQGTKSWAQQALKSGPRHVIGPTYLELTYNRGAAFSLGTGATPVIAAVAVGLVVAVGVYSRRQANGGAPLAVIVGLGLLTGGALSNLADRIVRHHHGAVVDFISLVSWWAVFNLADAAISVGVLTLAVSLVFFPRARRPSAPPVTSGGGRAAGSALGIGAGPGGDPDH